MEHQIKEIGDLEKPYITRYCLDLDIKAVATEIRIHAGENGKFHIPDEYKADVSYGSTVKAIAAFLYSEGIYGLRLRMLYLIQGKYAQMRLL